MLQPKRKKIKNRAKPQRRQEKQSLEKELTTKCAEYAKKEKGDLMKSYSYIVAEALRKIDNW